MFFPGDDLQGQYESLADGTARISPAAGGPAVDVLVMLADETEVVLQGDAQTDVIVLRCVSAHVETVRRGDRVRWDDQDYVLRRDPARIHDGQESQLLLGRAS